MGENEQPRQPGSGNLPDIPETPPAGVGPDTLGTPPAGVDRDALGTPPAGVDPETFRQFQEFQRFQQFQQFTQGQQPAAPPWTAEGGNIEPVHPVHHQLGQVQAQLNQIQQSQAKIERATNPPLWRKILRSTPFRWAVGLLVLIMVAIWGVPALVEHYVGGDNAAHNNNAGKPTGVGDSGLLADSSYDAIMDAYLFATDPYNKTPDRSCLIFSPGAQKSFAQAFGVPTCPAAFAKITGQITDQGAYSQPDMSMLPVVSGDSVTVNSCAFKVTGGPRLGTFTVTKEDKGWWITSYQAQQPC